MLHPVRHGFTHIGQKGSEYSTSYDILDILLSKAAPKDFRKFKFLKLMEDAVIEIGNESNEDNLSDI